MTVTITKELIAAARHQSDECPIALFLRQNGYPEAICGKDYWYERPGGERHFYSSNEAIDFTQNYKDNRAKPTSFEV